MTHRSGRSLRIYVLIGEPDEPEADRPTAGPGRSIRMSGATESSPPEKLEPPAASTLEPFDLRTTAIERGIR